MAAKWAFPAETLPLLSILAKFKGLRGRWFDPFGWTHERREERALIGEYEGLIDLALIRLDGERRGNSSRCWAWRTGYGDMVP